MKYTFIRILRVLGLLKLADSTKFVVTWGETRKRNRTFTQENPDYATPPPDLSFDALNHIDWGSYKNSGQVHAAVFAGIIDRSFPAGRSLEILEWGCGPGRIIRHLAEALSPRDVTLLGSDYNARSVAWCRSNLPGITFLENSLTPPLALPAEQLDVIYNFSVLTHLSEAVQIAWVGELHRLLRPGGLLVCTTHGERFRYLLTNQIERERFDAGELVEQGRYREGRKWFFAIHPERFVRDRLLAGFTDVHREQHEGADQEFWIARKPGPVAAN